MIFELIMQKTASAVIAWAVSFYTLYMRTGAKFFETDLRFKRFYSVKYTFIPFYNLMRLKRKKMPFLIYARKLERCNTIAPRRRRPNPLRVVPLQ